MAVAVGQRRPGGREQPADHRLADALAGGNNLVVAQRQLGGDAVGADRPQAGAGIDRRLLVNGGRCRHPDELHLGGGYAARTEGQGRRGTDGREGEAEGTDAHERLQD